MLHRFPFRVSFFLAALGFAPAVFLPASAQTHKVEAPEKVTRAIAVYEWTGDLAKPSAARLIPVSLFIEKHFEDAGVYLARPIPFALRTGDVYSVERAGEHIGTLDLDFARNLIQRHSGGDDNAIGAWYGYGTFIDTAEETKLAAARAARIAKLHPGKTGVIVGGADESSDDKPHMVRRDSASTTSTSPTDKSTSDRPTLDRRTDTASTTTPDIDDDPDRPTLRHRDLTPDQPKTKKSKEGGYVSPPNTSLNDDPDRPTMHRGIPAGQVVTAQLSGMPPNLHQSAAVSDAANRDEHIFNREWESSKEHINTLVEIEALARPRVMAYIASNKLVPMSTTPAPAASTTPAKPTPTAARRKAQSKPLPPPTFAFANEQLSGYTLSYGGMPTFIYTAETPVTTGGPVYTTLVAQRLPSGELQVALASTTDATHMDRVPWMRPVDVVDPDWSHRGSLLFELRAQNSRQFALYSLTSPQAEQTFVTGIIE